jgi:Protein of unknown function (DUF3443)
MFMKFFIGLAMCGILTTGAVGVTADASVQPGPADVPVSVLDGQGTTEGARPTVEVRVGTSNSVPVLLDTGSSGLHIFDTAVETGPGSGVTLTSQPANITYSGGDSFTGIVGSAVVTIGSYATKSPVPFSYVEQASCIPSKPSCPASSGIPGYEQSGMYGILGIGTQKSGGGIISPILGMAHALGKTWSLHLNGTSGALILGAPVPAKRSATVIPMTRIGTSTGHALWADDQLPLCLSVGSADECVSGLFDSGTYSMQISGTTLDQVPTTPGTDQVVSGTPVDVALKGATDPFWTFTSGTTKSEDLVTVKTDRGPFVNTGVQAFYDFTVTYDDGTGQIRLSREGTL